MDHALNSGIRRLMTACAAVIAVLAVSPLSVAQQLPESIVDIRIEGNETIDEAVILQKIQTQPGRSLSNRMIREDKRNLMMTRWFYSVIEEFRSTPQGTVLVFRVQERPIVRSVQFVGNSKVKTKYLTAWTGLKAGSPFDHIANREAVHRVEQEYKEKGHFFVKVSLRKGGSPSDRDIIFDISEGPKVRVQHFEFRGVQDGTVSAGRLKTKLLSKKAILGMFSGLYRPETLREDELAIRQYYKDLGFFDVQVASEALFSPDRSAVKLVYNITEGPRFRVRNVVFDGNAVLSEDQLRSDSELIAGQYFNALPLSKDVRRMLQMYGERGHYFASVVPVPRFTEQSGVVDLVFEINEDRPRFIRDFNVVFDGDYSHTKETVILNSMQVEPGDLADPRRINMGRSRTASGQIFDTVQLEVVPVDPENDGIYTAGRTIRGTDGHAGPRTWLDEFRSNAQDSAAEYSHSAAFRAAAPSLATPVQADGQMPSGHSLNRSSVPVGRSVRSGHAGPSPGAPQAVNSPSAGMNSTSAGRSDVRSLPQRLDVPRQTVSDLLPRLFDSGHEVAAVFHQPVNPFLNVGRHAAEAESDVVIRAQNGRFDSQFPGQPGDRFNPALEGSPYYNQYQSVPPGYVDLNIRASEGRTGRLLLGGGINSDAGLVGSFVWEESNFDLFNPPRNFGDLIEGRAWRGGGQSFRFEAAPGDIVSRYALSWRDPYFLYSDYSLGVSAFYFNRFYPDWDETRGGGQISVGRQLTPEWSIGTALRLENVEVENPRNRVIAGTPPPELNSAVPGSVVGSNFLSTVRVSATHDNRDAIILPGSGHYVDFSYEQAFGDFNYPRFEGEFRQYFTVLQRPDGSGRHVLTLAGTLGWSGADTPIFERYYAGGFQSFRGFAFRGVSPVDDGVAIGGTHQLLGTVEYRIPVTADDMLQVVGFMDVGTVDYSVSSEDIRATAGFGLRVVVPALSAAPLAFDFGFPIRTKVTDDERIFSFYVGINR